MIAALKLYPDYKPAGVLWLGDVPAQWEVRRLKNICSFAYGDSLPEEARRPGAVPVFGSNGRVGEHDIANTLVPCLIIGRKGSFGKIRFSGKPVHAIDTTFFVDTRHTSADLRWLYYVLCWVRLDTVSRDSAVPGLNRGDAYQTILPLPPLPEQAAIVRYLDHHDRLIQRYIRAKKKLVALLEEQKQAIIHRAVTRGLDPNVRLKSSGVEWLGDVPEHWGVRRLRCVVDLRVSNVDKHKIEGEPPVRLCNYIDVYHHDRITDAIQFMHATATREEIERFRLQIGDVIITKDSESWNDIGVPAFVEYTATDLVCGYHLAVLRPRSGVLNGGYLLRALQSQGVAVQYHISANGITRYGLSQGAIKSVLIPLPPLSEQAAIVLYLDMATADINTASTSARREIELLREYRTRLIADVVTGKLDVRGIDLPELDEDDELDELEDLQEASGSDEMEKEENDAE